MGKWENIHSLPQELFESPYFFLLESSLGGRYTIAAWEPSKVIIGHPGDTGFFETLRKELRQSPAVDAPDLPFCGGWIGYLGYELYSELEPKVPERKPDLIPKAVFCFYDRYYLYDHLQEKVCAFRPSEKPATAAPKSNFERSGYLSAVRQIKKYIAAGDCYQVNLSQKFTATVSQPSAHVYQRLRAVSPSPYAAYLNLGDAQILSSSPESFLSVEGRRVVTRPIKGTRPRGRNDVEDAALKEELSTSAKDRAELLMITDLERNDLGRVCAPGSIRVADLAKVETYPQVHHLVSTIEGELAQGRDIVDLLQAMFPGGSITGAPKIRAMQIIRELEPHARDVYCGAIGYVSLNGKAQFNVAIRTMVVKDGQATFWSGGGIVADSDPEKEYEETMTKAKGMIEALS